MIENPASPFEIASAAYLFGIAAEFERVYTLMEHARAVGYDRRAFDAALDEIARLPIRTPDTLRALSLRHSVDAAWSLDRPNLAVVATDELHARRSARGRTTPSTIVSA